ncbi:MAG: anthranilate phosphoribosyltransferase [Sulfurospirillum sp.]|nr:anthranilate phosphoribosyltransferase [Sulfurospirillum sp.]MBL0703828.1 anthranilate phosphoribosyltransferase [Sulfurospirillum sp.]
MNYSESKKIFEELFKHNMSDTKMRDFLVSLKLDESISVEAIAASASVMRANALPLHVDESLQSKLLDIVGTGGDKIGSFNISSTVALVCAAGGCFVAKHGSRSVTSRSGSADMFEKLGVRLDLSLESSVKLLEETGFTFMFAANHHPAMKFIMPIRKSISEKTIFNILGPLTNPAFVKKSMLGVFDKIFVSKIAEALRLDNSKSALVVSSRENMDEISISDITYAARLLDGHIEEFEIDSQNYGIKKAPLSSIIGGSAKYNATLVHDIFSSKATDAQRDIVLMNTAASLMVDGKARDLQDGLEIAKEIIDSKKAIKKLKQIVAISNSL